MGSITNILFALLLANAYCDDCVKYSFEEDFEDLFRNDGICAAMASWQLGEYASIDVQNPVNTSRRFVTPRVEYSCSTSFTFPMSPGGKIEIVIYLGSVTAADQLIVIAEQIISGGTFVVGQTFISPGTPEGWQTLTLNIAASSSSEGYVHFLGMASSDSLLLVDSFAYTPPNYEGSCWISDDANTTIEPSTGPTTAVWPETTASTEPSTETPTDAPTELPTEVTTELSTDAPTEIPTETPTELPTETTTELPTEIPTEPSTEPPTELSTEPSIEADATTLEPTTTPMPTLPNGCPVDPQIHWLLPHVKNCTEFYYCVWGALILRECPAGLHFNPELQVCDWPFSAGCTSL